MAAVALPTVADLVKGTFDESLKKLVQPAAIIPAGVLILVHAVFLYPVAAASGWSAATWFASLDGVWQAAIITAIILGSGYLILNLSPSILRVATGESWARTWLYRTLANRQRKRSEALNESIVEAKRAGDESTAARLRLEQTRLPDHRAIAPTELGNAFAGLTKSVEGRYGIDASGLWPHLRAVMGKDDIPLRTDIDEEAVSLQVLLNVAAVLVFVALEAVLVHLLVAKWTGAAQSVVLLPVAYLFYRAAVVRARSYVDGIEAAFDLYRDELAKALGVELPQGFEKARDAWRKVSSLLVYDLEPDEEPPAPDPLAGLSVSTSPNVTATTVAKEVGPQVEADLGDSIRKTWRTRYVIAVTSASNLTVNAFVTVRDKDLSDMPAIPAPEGTYALVAGESLEATGPAGAGIMWRIRNLQSRSSVVLDYSLETSFIEARRDGGDRSVSLAEGLKPGANDVDVTIGSTVSPDVPAKVNIKVSWLPAETKVRCTWRQDDGAKDARLLAVDSEGTLHAETTKLGAGSATLELRRA